MASPEYNTWLRNNAIMAHGFESTALLLEFKMRACRGAAIAPTKRRRQWLVAGAWGATKALVGCGARSSLATTLLLLVRSEEQEEIEEQ
jgi:hypothetical protein